MASQNRIDVFANGDFQTNPTQVSLKQPQATQVGQGTTELTLRNSANFGLLLNTAKNVGNIATGRIGEITGNNQLQKGIGFIGTAVAFAGGIAINPVLGFANVLVSGVSALSDRFFESRKNNTESQFYRRLQMGTTNNSRGKGGKV